MVDDICLRFFVVSVLVSSCSAASFRVILREDNSRGKRAVDGRDIAGVRDGSDILAKDTNPALSTIDGSGIVNTDLINDRSKILAKDTNPSLSTIDVSDITNKNFKAAQAGIDGRDIAGVRDGSDILAKDTNPALSAIDGFDIVNKDLIAAKAGIDGRDIAGVRDGSDILAKDTNPALSAIDGSDIVNKDLIADQAGIDGRDIAGVRDGSDILAKDTNPALSAIDGSDIVNKDLIAAKAGIDGRDIAGVRDGSDILAKDTNPALSAIDGSDIVNKDLIAAQAGIDGRDIAGVRDGSDILAKDTNPALSAIDGSDIVYKDLKAEQAGIDGRDIAGVRDGSDILGRDSNSGQNIGSTGTDTQPSWYYEPTAWHMDPQAQYDTTTEDQSHGDYETTTEDPEHETTTHDPDEVQPSSGHGSQNYYNPLHMTRPGELPPMALPMTSEGGDTPIALAQTASKQPAEGHGSEQVPYSDVNPHTEELGRVGTHNPENPLYMSREWQQGFAQVHDMPQALPMTGHLDTQEHGAPVAMAQKGFSPSSTERKKGRGGSFSGVGGGKEAGGAGRKSFGRGGGKGFAGGAGKGFAGGAGKGLAGGPGKGFSGGPGKGITSGLGKKGFASGPGKKGMMKEGGGFGGAGKARPPPKWAHATDPMAGGHVTVTDSGHFAAGTTVPMVAAGGGGGGMMNNMLAMNMMRGGGTGDMFSEMMEMQRRMMRNNPQVMQQQMQMYRQMFPQMFGGVAGGGTGAGISGTAVPQAGMPMMPMYNMMGGGEEGEGGMMNSMNQMAMANAMNLNFQSPYMQQVQQVCQKNPKSPICKMGIGNTGMAGGGMAGVAAGMAGAAGMGMGIPGMGIPGMGIPGMGMMGMGMMGETQIEGPMGEMDMEPGEMDIEGPIAYQLLQRLNMGGVAGVAGMGGMTAQNVHPLHHEITLNHHVLKALQKRFGVNTTAGIQKKATDPQFQAFMFHVLKQSHQSTPGEYHANLSKAQVDKILAGLGASAAGNERLPPRNLDHATLKDVHMEQGISDSAHGAVLTLDTPGSHHTNWQTPFGAQASVAQPGAFQALVQTAAPTTTLTPTVVAGQPTGQTSKQLSATGEVGKVTPLGTTGTNASTLSEPGTQTGSSGSSGTADGHQLLATLLGSTVAADLGLQNQQLGTSGGMLGTGSVGMFGTGSGGMFGTGLGQGNQPLGTVGQMGNFGETRRGDNEIRNKDEIPGLSQDARNRAFGKIDKNKKLAAAPAPGVITDTRPIGLQEAGLYPGGNETVPVKKIQVGYTTSTAFAIAAIVLIAVIIIIGPIFCMLCKMREKREERRRKMKALKNREVSENNIMEAMMLHEFGSSGANSIENEAAMSPNYYKNGPTTRYDTIDPEIECLNQSHPLP